jgi:predicted DNA-binding transcriptional regulator YafY
VTPTLSVLVQAIRTQSTAPRNRQVRQWGILNSLHCRCGVTVAELAQRYGVCTRTVFRDLEALQDALFPIIESDGRWRFASWEPIEGRPGRFQLSASQETGR